MCGVSGIIYKNSRVGGPAPVGRNLMDMLGSLVHRGRDSSGVTVVGPETSGQLIIRVWAGDRESANEVFARVEDAVLRVGGVVQTRDSWQEYLRLGVAYVGNVPYLAEALVGTEGVDLHSIGRASEIVKDVGTAVDMDQKHGVSSLNGTHGIGHVRMATESRVDINHSHPFWAYPFEDVSVVHNGQLTNYHKLKRKYEDAGHRFQTNNDSELIAVYLADKLSLGYALDQALHSSLDDLDGTFTYLICTRDGLGYAKDKWSAKPLVIRETEEVVVIASEEVALNSVLPDSTQRSEPQESKVMTWSI